MHHKRGRPKSRRAGCLLCKPHKANGFDRRGLDEIQKDNEKIKYERLYYIPIPDKKSPVQLPSYFIQKLKAKMLGLNLYKT